MRFKGRILFIAFSGLFALTSCSLYEGPGAPRKKEFSQGSLGCLKNFSVRADAYLDGKSTPDDVNKMADCAIGAIRTFGELAHGKNQDKFTAVEIRDFVQRYFMDDLVLTDGFVKEVMRLKQAFIGGKSSDFTPEDLKSAEAMIETAREIFLRLEPSMPISMERTKTADAAYVDALARAMVDSADLFGNKITENKTTYSFEEMSRLITETVQVFHGAENLLPLRDQLRLGGILKETLISPNRPRDVVTAAEWKLIIQDGARWAGVYLRALNLKARETDWMRGDARMRFGSLIDQTLDLVLRVTPRHCPEAALTHDGGCKIASGIPLKSLKTLVDELEWDGNVGGMHFEKSTVKSMLGPIILRVLGGIQPDESGRKSDRLTSAHLERLRSLVHEWQDGARYLEADFAKLKADPKFPSTVSATSTQILSLDPAALLQESGGSSPAALTTAEGIRDEIAKTVSLVSSQSATTGAVFDGANAKRERNYNELTRYTWLKPTFKRIVLGYIDGANLKNRAQNVERDGLTEAEFTNLISDFWPVLVDSKLVGPKNIYSVDAAKRFREAALFTQISDGNPLISIDEGMQLILYMISTDPLSKKVHERAVALCGGGPLDDFGQPTVKADCYRSRVWNFGTQNKEMNDLWAPFPLFMKFYDTLKPDQKVEVQRYIEMAARKPDDTVTTPYRSDDSQASVMILHYIESLFMRFDMNGDGFINREEAHGAFQVFSRVLGELAKMDQSDSKLESVFYWVLSRGAPPVNDNMGWWSKIWSSGAFLSFHLRNSAGWEWAKPEFNASRLELLKVFATLSTPAKL